MAKRKQSLGRGLDSLFDSPSSDANEEKASNVPEKQVIMSEMLVDINSVEPNKEQPRKCFNEDALH